MTWAEAKRNCESNGEVLYYPDYPVTGTDHLRSIIPACVGNVEAHWVGLRQRNVTLVTVKLQDGKGMKICIKRLTQDNNMQCYVNIGLKTSKWQSNLMVGDFESNFHYVALSLEKGGSNIIVKQTLYNLLLPSK